MIQKKVHQFRKLTVWQRAMQFTVSIYALTRTFPQEERFGLIDQLRRAVVSISLNIAEGSGCGSTTEFIRFLQIARRSAYEVITCLETAKNLQYGKEEAITRCIKEAEEISSMLTGLMNSLQAS